VTFLKESENKKVTKGKKILTEIPPQSNSFYVMMEELGKPTASAV